jgi:hypothetical protein
VKEEEEGYRKRTRKQYTEEEIARSIGERRKWKEDEEGKR